MLSSWQVAFLAGAWAAAEAADGCCYDFGFGDNMKPCCLETRTAVNAKECKLESAFGGGAGFAAGGICPVSAEAAAALWQQQSKERLASTGCCFSYGLGSRDKPCCLTTWLAHNVSRCGGAEAKLGGQMGFSDQGCPASPEAAAALLQPEAEARGGCCFVFGYGSLMRPCCLGTWRVQNSAECPVQRRLGGATGYAPGACPKSANEAKELWKQDTSSASDSKALNAAAVPATVAASTRLGQRTLSAAVSGALAVSILLFVLVHRRPRQQLELPLMEEIHS